MKKLILNLAATLLALSMPLGAYAVSASSNDGFGYQNRTKTYGNGAALSGKITSTKGKSVYFQGQVLFNNAGCESSGALAYSGSKF